VTLLNQEVLTSNVFFLLKHRAHAPIRDITPMVAPIAKKISELSPVIERVKIKEESDD
jgi:hypothetical protein